MKKYKKVKKVKAKIRKQKEVDTKTKRKKFFAEHPLPKYKHKLYENVKKE